VSHGCKERNVAVYDPCVTENCMMMIWGRMPGCDGFGFGFEETEG
jgi:hypothetical protein